MLAFLSKMWHNKKHREKREKRGVHLYLLLEKRSHRLKASLRKGKWKVAFLVDILRNLIIGISV